MRNHLPHIRAIFLTRDEQLKLLHCLELQPPHFRLAASLQLLAGLRIGEATNALWRWLKPNPETAVDLLIPAATTKTQTPRVVPLTPHLQHLLRTRWAQISHAPWISEPLDARIVATEKQNRYTPRWANKKLANISKNNSLRHFHTHCLRHTFANNLLQVTNLKVVQTLLGHTTLATTQLYLHPDMDQLRNAVDSAAAFPYVTPTPRVDVAQDHGPL